MPTSRCGSGPRTRGCWPMPRLVHAAVGDTARARELLTAAVTLSPTVDPLLMARVRAELDRLTQGATS